MMHLCKLLVCVVLFFALTICYGQENALTTKGSFQIQVSFSLSSINVRQSKIKFAYTDKKNTPEVIDSIKADYTTQKKRFGKVICINFTYNIAENIGLVGQIRPHLNSFRSNKNKTGRVYGAQLNAGLQHYLPHNKKIVPAVGVTVAKIFGGYGITSGGPKNKTYLSVKNDSYYDDDIGFHIIHQALAIQPFVTIDNISIQNFTTHARVNYVFLVKEKAEINIAGFTNNKTVKWNRLPFTDESILFVVDSKNIDTDYISKLPYRFTGWLFDIGVGYVPKD
ncbi:MAG: hypothetical protein ACK5WV_06120 [Chryseotalea sp.]|jgi:hypothetical protein